ncbi:hypothetical protein GCM10010401_10960 [Rarobacter faecitabidus]|uniref:Uncharacterized protein n=1 Tax=Rarobacter faecitabidus TaxID=13243 RepID=A0A542ZP63_RARFA|nr:hypothetical protein [Rarobacter faecitabidus]TQL62161.1 hypothetical protein FB461_1799 [Rarobacter faecitabidus]
MISRRIATFVTAAALLGIGLAVPASAAQAATPAKAKKFAASVAKTYGAGALTKDKYAVVYRKAQGTKHGYTFSAGAGYVYDADDYTFESSATTKAFQAKIGTILKQRGLKVIKKRTKSSPAVLFANKTYTCSIAYAAFACTTTKAATKAAKKLKPFLTGYRGSVKGTRYEKFDTVVGYLNHEKSNTKGYKIATVVVDGLPMMSGASALYFKAPGKGWKFVRAGQDVPLCSLLEKSKDSRNAFVGKYCYRDDHDSKVRL